MLQDDAVVSYSNKLLQSSVKVLQISTIYVDCPGPDQGREGSRRCWIRWWQILTDLRHFLTKRKIHPPQPRDNICDNFETTWRQHNLETTRRQLRDNFGTTWWLLYDYWRSEPETKILGRALFGQNQQLFSGIFPSHQESYLAARVCFMSNWSHSILHSTWAP